MGVKIVELRAQAKGLHATFRLSLPKLAENSAHERIVDRLREMLDDLETSEDDSGVALFEVDAKVSGRFVDSVDEALDTAEEVLEKILKEASDEWDDEWDDESEDEDEDDEWEDEEDDEGEDDEDDEEDEDESEEDEWEEEWEEEEDEWEEDEDDDVHHGSDGSWTWGGLDEEDEADETSDPEHSRRHWFTPSQLEFLQLAKLDFPCSLKELSRGYRNLALQHHPDRGGNAETFVRLNQAYRELQVRIEG